MPIDTIPDLKNILAIRLDNIGDVIMLGPALRALKKTYPNARITLLCSPAGNEAARLLPWIDATIVWRAVWQDISKRGNPDLQAEANLVDTLKLGRYDAAFIFTSFNQSPYPPAFAAYLAGIPVRVGQSKEFGGALLTDWFKPLPDDLHQVDRDLYLLTEFGIPSDGKNMEIDIPDSDRLGVERILAEIGIDPSSEWIAAVPGASCTARRYTPERFSRTIQILVEQYGKRVVILGSRRDERHLGPMVEQIRSLPGVISLIGETSIGEFAEILRRSRLVIANNSSALHIADAFERPLVVLYSGTEYLTQWEPRFSPAKILQRKTTCSPCYRFECPYHMECLDISPEEVASSVMDLMDQTSNSQNSPHPYEETLPESKTR